jgi:hypothetical protein
MIQDQYHKHLSTVRRSFLVDSETNRSETERFVLLVSLKWKENKANRSETK